MDALDFLFSLERLGMKFGLENMTRLCAALGHPERGFRPIVVAGTNGKGSVTAMISAALHAAGLKSARYTSPHLERLEERFVISEREVQTDELRQAAGRIQAAVELLMREGVLASQPTFFECATAIAFELFRCRSVDVAVLEVGLGGRLDATNVVTPIIAAITSIDFDHQAQLGDTLEAIAREKAGVIKQGIPVVCGDLPAVARQVIEEEARAHDAPLVTATDRLQITSAIVDGDTIATFQSTDDEFVDVRLALRGRHQAHNAAVAICVLEELNRLGVAVDRTAIHAALTRTVWPGRLERRRRNGADVLLDAAHNPAGARALEEYLRATGWNDVTLVLGAMRDKDIAGMVSALAPSCARLVCTTACSPRAMSAAELAAIARGVRGAPPTIEVIADPGAALERACEPGSRVVVAGSIFLIGPLRGILR